MKAEIHILQNNEVDSRLSILGVRYVRIAEQEKRIVLAIAQDDVDKSVKAILKANSYRKLD